MTNEATERLERWLVKFRDAVTRRAHAEAEYELLDHQRKVILAEAMKAAEADGHSSVAAQEREARASVDYDNCLNDLHDARLELELARGEVDALKLSASLAQTIKANERAEVRAYGST